MDDERGIGQSWISFSAAVPGSGLFAEACMSKTFLLFMKKNDAVPKAMPGSKGAASGAFLYPPEHSCRPQVYCVVECRLWHFFISADKRRAAIPAHGTRSVPVSRPAEGSGCHPANRTKTICGTSLKTAAFEFYKNKAGFRYSLNNLKKNKRIQKIQIEIIINYNDDLP